MQYNKLILIMVNNMTYKTFNKELFNFIDNSTSSFTSVLEIKKILLNNNFSELKENEEWNLSYNNKYFVTRSDASIIAFCIGSNNNLNITCTHIDTPSLMIKPKNTIYEKNYMKVNVTPYGGLLDYAWLDEPLSISGRVIIKKGTTYYKKIVDFKRPLLCIPSVAIHQNENANDNLNINPQIDMLPIISLTKTKDPINDLIKKELKLKNNEEICDYDLFLYSVSHPTYFGLNNEFISSPRIDDLTCTFSALKAFLDNKSKNKTNIFCAFNSEEIGSLTKEGADSSFLMDIIKRISAYTNIDINTFINNGTILSADNTHATHPNHPDNSDTNNSSFLNEGVVISKDPSSTTNSITSSIVKGICTISKVPYQDFVTKNDMASGSTLSGISLRHVSIDSIDLGLCSLAMHASKEVIGSKDTFYLYKTFKTFFETYIIKDKDKITLNTKSRTS